MFGQVTFEIGLLSKTTIAQVARELLLAIVNVANVTLKVGGDGKGSFAIFAAVGLNEQAFRDDRDEPVLTYLFASVRA